MSTNPYAAPQTTEIAQDTLRLYSPVQVAVGAFLGGFAAGGILLALNFRRWGRPAAAIGSVMGGIAATIVLIAVATTLPDRMPSMALSVAQAFAMLGIARVTQGEQFAAHLASGGETQKGWRPVVISLATAAAIMGMILAVIALL